MKAVRIPVILFLMTLMAGSCIQDDDSNYDRIVERDNRFLKDYLERNNITAIENQLGYYYEKVESNDVGNQIVNDDVLGIYYEIKTIDGQLIESYLDESKSPRIFKHNDGGLIPRVINFNSGLAKEGETFMIYSPSYLAYQEYGFQQLIIPNSNLVIKVKYAFVFSEEDLIALEDDLIQNYLEEKGLEGFEKTEEGLYVRVLNAGKEGAKVSAKDNIVLFEFEVKQMLGDNLISKSNTNSPIQIKIGDQGNLSFLNLGLIGTKEDMEFEILSPSKLAFGVSPQVFPFQIRQDLFNRGALNVAARPYEPIYFKAKIKEVK
ncbi:FKBP-type peptidyl-prolyl cis-trans isomerase [Belliella sp. DSM 107340]|uniref:Peptidyl-prolyl cis-trans isomerase n=1 Tax=Belliella calami TaxID=2923436 RepID=A0ABS9ULT1_9BACT|nr:FKBP-type peptidyl-prolyl cis-trans isomerase [Belliella calami]MCH7397592.1 FKBP-type peptidyl-prolyl cis-trans isomerase [Belliella calami]